MQDVLLQTLKIHFEKEEFDYVIPMDGDGEDRHGEEMKKIVKSIKKTYLNKLLLEKGLKDLKLSFLRFLLFS